MTAAVILALCGILTFVAVKSSYYILKFLAGVAWFGLGAWWIANPFTTQGEPTDVIMLIVVFVVGLAMMFMPLWYESQRNGTTVGKFRIPFLSPTEDEEESEKLARSLPTRSERSAAYRERVDSAINGRR